MEHYPVGLHSKDLEMKALGMNRFAYYSEIDVEDTDSDIYDEGVMSESDLEGFVVSDSEIEGQDITPPPGHESIDKEWNEWEANNIRWEEFQGNC